MICTLYKEKQRQLISQDDVIHHADAKHIKIHQIQVTRKHIFENYYLPVQEIYSIF